MKTALKTTLALPVVAILSTGCAMFQPGGTSRETGTAETRPVEPAPEQTQASPQKVAQVVRSKVVVAVKDTSSDPGPTTREVAVKSEGRLIDRGFAVKGIEPFMTVRIGTDIVLFDKIGNYYVYEGTSDADIIRNDTKVLGRRQFVIKGDRALDQSRAKRSVSDKLADEVSSWVAETCTARAMGVESIIVTLRISEWESFLGGQEKAARRKIESFANEANKLDGILSCHLVETGPSNRMFRFRVVYQADKFPDGVFTGMVQTDTLPEEIIESNPVLWLLKAVFGTAGALL